MVKLSERQEAFARLVVEGRSLADAYRETHPNSRKWKPESVWAKSSELAKLDKVSIRIGELRQQAQERVEVTLENLTEDLRRVMGAAEAAGDHSAAVAAIRQISKMHGLDTEKRANERSPLDGLTTKARAELRATIETALEKARRDASDEVA